MRLERRTMDLKWYASRRNTLTLAVGHVVIGRRCRCLWMEPPCSLMLVLPLFRELLVPIVWLTVVLLLLLRLRLRRRWWLLILLWLRVRLHVLLLLLRLVNHRHTRCLLLTQNDGITPPSGQHDAAPDAETDDDARQEEEDQSKDDDGHAHDPRSHRDGRWIDAHISAANLCPGTFVAVCARWCTAAHDWQQEYGLQERMHDDDCRLPGKERNPLCGATTYALDEDLWRKLFRVIVVVILSGNKRHLRHFDPWASACLGSVRSRDFISPHQFQANITTVL